MKDPEGLQAFLEEMAIGHLALSADDRPYCVPLNFVYRDGKFFFHAAEEGRKIRILQRNPQACFTVSRHIATIVDPVPCGVGTAYASVIAEGTVRKLEDLTGEREVLQAFLDKYMPGFFRAPLSELTVDRYRSTSTGSRVAVFVLDIETITAKSDDADPSKYFRPGDTVERLRG